LKPAKPFEHYHSGGALPLRGMIYFSRLPEGIMPSINKLDLVKAFSGVLDMVNNTLASHHLRVAYITDQICGRLEIPAALRHRTLIAAMLHDIGVIPLHDQADNLVFEKEMQRHSNAGWLLLSTCALLREEGRIIRYHHTNWNKINQLDEGKQLAARLGNIIHLADMIDVNVRTHPGRLPRLLRIITDGSGSLYAPDYVEAARDIVSAPDFFNDLTEAAKSLPVPLTDDLALSRDETTLYSQLFSHVIDARSPFTATHSSGVAHLGLFLHRLAGMEDMDRPAMFVAGLLHDIGKVGVPLEYIEKEGPLTKEEFAAVSCHAGISYEVLSSIPGFNRIAPWGAWHHERLNGGGYPNRLSGEAIPAESRIIAVADVLTALTEDRPYRPGLDNDQTLKILDKMVAEGGLDGDIVSLVRANIEDINQVRLFAQTLAGKFFRGLTSDIRKAVGESPDKA